MPGPDAPPEGPRAADLLQALRSEGLYLCDGEVQGVLETAQYLHRATGLVAQYLQGLPDEPR